MIKSWQDLAAAALHGMPLGRGYSDEEVVEFEMEVVPNDWHYYVILGLRLRDDLDTIDFSKECMYKPDKGDAVRLGQFPDALLPLTEMEVPTKALVLASQNLYQATARLRDVLNLSQHRVKSIFD